MTVNLPEIVAFAACHYILVIIVTLSEVMKPFRTAFRVAVDAILPYWAAKKFVVYDRDRFAITKDPLAHPYDGSGYDFISCRLCVGFWVALFGAIALKLDPITAIAAYGLSHFATMMEPIEP